MKVANESRLSNVAEAGRIAPAIETKLKEKAQLHNLPKDSNGFPISFMHEAVIGDVIPTPNRTSTDLTLQSDDYVVKTEICNGMHACKQKKVPNFPKFPVPNDFEHIVYARSHGY